MNILAGQWQPYRLPLATPWITQRGRRDALHGEWLRLSTDDGRHGWGDAAPLPEFGIPPAAARAFARETALLDLAAQERGLPLNALLSLQPAVPSLTVHRNLGAISRIDPQRVAESLHPACSLLKLKVGVISWTDEIQALEALCAHLPGSVRLRLDANQAWPAGIAADFLRACVTHGLPVESIEEPLRADDGPSLRHHLRALQATTPFAIAVDESANQIDSAFLRDPPVRRLVIKPARHGGLLASLLLARLASAAGLECIVTSALESHCGVLACAHLAAAIAPRAIHGLHAPALAGTNAPRQERELPTFILPEQPGLGFRGPTV